MPITRPTRPEVIVSGVAVVVAPRTKYDNDLRRYTDEVTGYEVTVSQPSGAQLAVRYPLDENGNSATPEVLTAVNVVVTVSESREYGASLTFARDVTEDDLDKMHSTLLASAK